MGFDILELSTVGQEKGSKGVKSALDSFGLIGYRWTMSRPLRIEYPNAWYHVLNRGRWEEPIFREAKDYDNFLQTVQEACEFWHLRVVAYCLMATHLLVQTPHSNLSRCLRHIDGVYTQRFNRKHGHDGPLFRGRFKALLIEADSYLLQLVRYIHRNPIQAGLAETLNDYPWSSHKGYLSKHPKWKWLHKEVVMEMLAGKPEERVKAYWNYVTIEDDRRLIRILSKNRWPAVLGSEKFIKGIKGKYFQKKADGEVPQSKELAPEMGAIIGIVSEYYQVKGEDLVHSRRGYCNEARNVAMYLSRRLRGDRGFL